MAHSALSDRTKKMMVNSLKKFMAIKPLNKISIREITDDCGINRQTFYYHFQDIYDLLAWMYEQEAGVLLKEHDNCLTWEDGAILLLRYIQANKAISLCTLNSLGHEHLKRLFYDDIYNLILTIVCEIEKTIGKEVSKEHKHFIAHFYGLAFAGLLENWLRSGMKETPEELVQLASITMDGNIYSALDKFAAEKPHD